MASVRVALYTFNPGTVDDVLKRAETGLSPLLRQLPGFIAYELVRIGDTAGASISTWQSSEHAEQANERIAAWVQENMADAVASAVSHIGELAFSTRSQ
jgi:heme-degrading monooxygenase HmoA